MCVIGEPPFFYHTVGGSAAHFESALLHESHPATTKHYVIKFTFFFRLRATAMVVDA